MFGRRLVSVACVVLAISVIGCNSGTVRSAAQRIDDAAALIAQRTGASGDDVAGRLRMRLSHLPDEQIATRAEEAASNTAWIDDAFAGIRAQREATARAVHGAACDWVDIADAMAQQTPEARYAAFLEIIVGHLDTQGVATDEQAIQEVWDEVVEQVNVANNGGTIDPSGAAIALACLW